MITYAVWRQIEDESGIPEYWIAVERIRGVWYSVEPRVFATRAHARCFLYFRGRE